MMYYRISCLLALNNFTHLRQNRRKTYGKERKIEN